MNKWFLVGLIICFMSLFISPTFAWLSGWDYRQAIKISNTAGDLTNYQVKLELNSSNFDYSNANTTGKDLRFTNSSDDLLDYWVENWNTTGDSIIGIEVPSLPNNANTTIYMYYSNPSASSESNANATLGNNILNFWTMDNNGIDRISGDNATINGATPITDRRGFTNSAYSFDGSNDNLQTSTPTYDTVNSYTISVWVYPRTNTTNSYIIDSHGTDNRFTILWYPDSATFNGFGILIGSGDFVTSSLVVSINEWHNVVAVGNGTHTILYVDGEYISSGAKTSDITTNGLDFATYGSEVYFYGYLDEARIYKRALSSSEIQKLYASPEPTYFIGSKESSNNYPQITINKPESITYYNTSIPVNVTVSDDSASFWCAIYEDSNLLSNETSNTTYTTTLTKTGGSHNVSVSCEDSYNASSGSVDYYVWMGLNVSVFYDNGTAAENWNISIQNVTDSYNNSSVNNSLVLEWSDIPTGEINITVDDAAPGLYYLPNFSQRNNNNSAYQVFNLTLFAKGDNPINLTADPSFNVFSGQFVTLVCSPTEGSANFYLQNILISSPYVFTTSAGTYSVKCNVSETENYRPTEKSETLTSTPLISCMDNETFAFSVNFTTTENITSVNFTDLVNQHYVWDNLGDVYVPGANETWINVSGGNYYLVVNNTDLSEIQVLFGNQFINRSYGDHAISNVKTIGSYIQENNYVYFDLLNEIDGGLAVPPNATIMIYFSCSRGYNYLFLESNITEFLLASLDYPDKISVRVQYTADSYYSRSLYPSEQDQYFLNFYNVDAYKYALDRIDFLMLDINYYSTKLQIYKLIGNETIIISENYFDASHMISEYLMEDTNYYLRTVASDGTITEFGKISVVEPTQKTLGKQTVNLNPQAVIIANYVSGNVYADASYQTLYVDYSDLMEQTDQVNITIYFENGTIYTNESYAANSLSLSYNISNFTNQSYWVDYSVIHNTFGNFTFGMEVSSNEGFDAGLPDWLNLMVAMSILIFIGGLATRSSIMVSTILLVSWLIMFTVIGWFPASYVFIGLLIIMGILGIIIYNRQGGE